MNKFDKVYNKINENLNPQNPLSVEKKIQDYIKNGSRGDLSLVDKPVVSLPDGFKVGGDLDLTFSTITSLPDNLKVGGDLILALTPITSLPKGLEVGRDLDLHSSKITSLPDNLKINGNLYLHHTPISFLPKGLNVRRELNILHTKITSLPEDLVAHKILHQIKGLDRKGKKLKTNKIQNFTPPDEENRNYAVVVDKIKNDRWLESGGNGERTWIKEFEDVDQAIEWIQTNKKEKDWENWEIEFADEEEMEEGVLVYYPGSGWQVDFT